MPPNPLHAWLQVSGLTYEQLQERLASHGRVVVLSSLRNLANSQYLPGRALASAIAKATKGDVPMTAWDDVEVRARGST